MGEVVKLISGRKRPGKIPKHRECEACGEEIETARLQVNCAARRCVSCAEAEERRHRQILEGARDRDIVIIRR